MKKEKSYNENGSHRGDGRWNVYSRPAAVSQDSENGSGENHKNNSRDSSYGNRN